MTVSAILELQAFFDCRNFFLCPFGPSALVTCHTALVRLIFSWSVIFWGIVVDRVVRGGPPGTHGTRMVMQWMQWLTEIEIL